MIMSDGDDENEATPKPGQRPSQPDPNSIMDLEFADFGSPWPFDPMIPASPFLISDQAFSSLWAFTDVYDDKSAGATNRRENNKDSDNVDNKTTLPTPILGLSSLELPDVFVIKERMTQALRYFKESTEQHQILAQVWAPVKSGNRYVLTTSGQPFVLGPHSNGLHQYRTVSQMFSFSVDEEPNGLPGRVFSQKLPEWTPDVQFYSSKEYPRVKHAKDYNVHGTLALPVFEPSRQSCVGVLELIMTSRKINYASEVDKVSKALEAVNLKSSEILVQPNIQICNKGRQNALSEILEVFTEVCETYKLPLAQTWVPCRHRSVLANGGGWKKSCSSFDGSCMGQVCMSTTDVAFYVVDARILGFREACAEHHLQKGQGVAGRAFSSLGLCFCEDISRFSKIEYPLVHYAKMFGLTSSFAICMRSKYTGEDDYVLEFFLPDSLTDSSEQHKMLDSILATMREHFHSLMVASGRSLEEERRLMEIVDVSMDEGTDFEVERVAVSCPTEPLAVPETLSANDKVTPEKDAVDESKNSAGISPSLVKETKKSSERKRGKAEKQISLEVLQQYFTGSLKDAAKSLGVCPTTMKRICRQHGISRWPSRKINKVNRSLTKLKYVIQSVQGPEGTFSLTPISPSSAPVVVGSVSWPTGLNGTNQQQSPSSKPFDFSDSRTDIPATTKPGSNGEEETTLKEQFHKQSSFLRGFELSRAGSGSREASNGSSTSHGSYHGSPPTETTPQNSCFPSKEMNFSSTFNLPTAHHVAHPQESFGGLLEDVGSSKDLRNLCSSIIDANMEEGILELGLTKPPTYYHHNNKPSTNATNPVMPRFGSRPEMKTVTIKATFREDIIRFKFEFSSNIVDLQDEVSKRLKLEVGTFEMKYLDDDHEWVLILCDSDLQECLDIARSSGSNIIRMSIHDILGNPGSSCESTGE
ncbi:hypothetical protein V2J09_004846 [Rumex salicifolius]